VPLVVLCAWIGIYPKPFLAFLHRPAAQIAALVQPGKFAGAAQAAGTAATVVPERVESVEVKAPPSPAH
jgi:hypothetical protein